MFFKFIHKLIFFIKEKGNIRIQRKRDAYHDDITVCDCILEISSVYSLLFENYLICSDHI